MIRATAATSCSPREERHHRPGSECLASWLRSTRLLNFSLHARASRSADLTDTCAIPDVTYRTRHVAPPSPKEPEAEAPATFTYPGDRSLCAVGVYKPQGFNGGLDEINGISCGGLM